MNTETLLLAAKAGGFEISDEVCCSPLNEPLLLVRDADDPEYREWNSKISLHDAADLANRLQMKIEHGKNFIDAEAYDALGVLSDATGYDQDHNNDRNLAYCHAVTECAAQVQREREKQQ